MTEPNFSYQCWVEQRRSRTTNCCLAGSSRTLEIFLTSATPEHVTQRRPKISVFGGFQDLVEKAISDFIWCWQQYSFKMEVGVQTSRGRVAGGGLQATVVPAYAFPCVKFQEDFCHFQRSSVYLITHVTLNFYYCDLDVPNL